VSRSEGGFLSYVGGRHLRRDLEGRFFRAGKKVHKAARGHVFYFSKREEKLQGEKESPIREKGEKDDC